jgi:hypothetical protein
VLKDHSPDISDFPTQPFLPGVAVARGSVTADSDQSTVVLYPAIRLLLGFLTGLRLVLLPDYYGLLSPWFLPGSSDLRCLRSCRRLRGLSDEGARLRRSF